MTLAKQKKKEKLESQQRLLGIHVGCGRKHCTACGIKQERANKKKPRSAPRRKEVVRLELREPEADKLMLDEENSAHQFSLCDASMQADSEERLDAEMQTQQIEKDSKQG